MLSTPHRSLLAVLAVCLPLSLLAASVKFDIPAQPAGSALQAFIRQSSMEVIFPSGELNKVQSTEVKGEMEPSTAISQLLTSTGYLARQTGPRNFAVAKIEAPKPGSVDGAVRDEAGKPVMGAKILLSDSDKMTVTDKRGRFSFSEVPAGAHSLQIAAEGLQNTRVTDIVVKPGMQHSLSPITIPVKKEGTLQLEDFVVSAKKMTG